MRAGILGEVIDVGPTGFAAVWQDKDRLEHVAKFATKDEAVAHAARNAAGGLRFHDLRHSYATWLVSDGVPINDAQRVMGHEQATTLLDLYTHASEDQDQRILDTFASDDDLHDLDEDGEGSDDQE